MTGELGVVVEHFLEVRDVPVSVRRVAREPAAQMIVDAALGHFFQGVENHVAGCGFMRAAVITQHKG